MRKRQAKPVRHHRRRQSEAKVEVEAEANLDDGPRTFPTEGPLNPCSECPFRKGSLRGYLGPHHDSEELDAIVMSDMYFPCHVKANQMIQHLREITDLTPHQCERAGIAAADYCVGALVYMNHHLKRNRDREISKLQDRAGERPDIFKTLEEMVEYHGI